MIDLYKKLNESEDDDFEIVGPSGDDIRILLADEFDVDPTEIEIKGNSYVLPDGSEYWVGTWEEAKDRATDELRNMLEDEGYFYLSEFDKRVARECMDDSYFDSILYDDAQQYAWEIDDEDLLDQASRFGIEVSDRDLDTSDDDIKFIGDTEQLRQDICDAYYDEYSDDPIQWFIDNFGEEEVDRIIEEGNAGIDWEELAKQLIDREYGYDLGELISWYDGYQTELGGIEDDYYAYRLN